MRGGLGNILQQAQKMQEELQKQMAQAQKEGRGAVALDGRLIDLASIRQAEVLVAKAQQISGAR